MLYAIRYISTIVVMLVTSICIVIFAIAVGFILLGTIGGTWANIVVLFIHWGLSLAASYWIASQRWSVSPSVTCPVGYLILASFMFLQDLSYGGGYGVNDFTSSSEAQAMQTRSFLLIVTDLLFRWFFPEIFIGVLAGYRKRKLKRGYLLALGLCVDCEYDLQGTPCDSNGFRHCPECGLKNIASTFEVWNKG